MDHRERTKTIYALQIPRAQKDVLLFLSHCAKANTLRCDPSISEMCQATGMHRATLLAARKALRKSGLITWVQRRINSTGCDTTEYWLAWLASAEADRRRAVKAKHKRQVGPKLDQGGWSKIRPEHNYTMSCADCGRTTHLLYEGRCDRCFRKANPKATPLPLTPHA